MRLIRWCYIIEMSYKNARHWTVNKLWPEVPSSFQLYSSFSSYPSSPNIPICLFFSSAFEKQFLFRFFRLSPTLRFDSVFSLLLLHPSAGLPSYSSSFSPPPLPLPPVTLVSLSACYLHCFRCDWFMYVVQRRDQSLIICGLCRSVFPSPICLSVYECLSETVRLAIAPPRGEVLQSSISANTPSSTRLICFSAFDSIVATAECMA